MNPTPCTPCCVDTQTVNTPGVAGASAITTTTASFVIPAIGGTVTIAVGDTSWITAGKNLYIGGANFVVTGVGSTTALTIKYLGITGDTASAATVASSAVVQSGLGNFIVPISIDAITAFTDSSGGVASNTIAVALKKHTVILGPFNMALLVNSQIWEVPVSHAFTVLSATFRCDIAITTGAKAATFTTRINAVNTTGGVIAVAGAYATGATQAGTAISGANTGTAGQTLEVIVSGVTTFTEGYGHIELVISNDDLAATLAAIAAKINSILTALT